MSRWPEPVREELPPRVITEQDIEDALRLTTRYLTEPEDPMWNPVTFGLLGAARGALIECADVLRMAEIGRELHGSDPGYSEWMRLGQVEVARRVARKIIYDLRKWLP